MNLLLDTHIFLWFVSDAPELSNSLKDLIENENNLSFLSVASLWEMSIKYNLGKLTLVPSYEEFVEREVRQSNIILLNIRLEHLKMNAGLPFYHKNPFDRIIIIIISQSLAESIPIVTVDSAFSQYSITLI